MSKICQICSLKFLASSSLNRIYVYCLFIYCLSFWKTRNLDKNKCSILIILRQKRKKLILYIISHRNLDLHNILRIEKNYLPIYQHFGFWWQITYQILGLVTNYIANTTYYVPQTNLKGFGFEQLGTKGNLSKNIHIKNCQFHFQSTYVGIC